MHYIRMTIILRTIILRTIQIARHTLMTTPEVCPIIIGVEEMIIAVVTTAVLGAGDHRGVGGGQKQVAMRKEILRADGEGTVATVAQEVRGCEGGWWEGEMG
jgi:hypothetical protein